MQIKVELAANNVGYIGDFPRGDDLKVIYLLKWLLKKYNLFVYGKDFASLQSLVNSQLYRFN